MLIGHKTKPINYFACKSSKFVIDEFNFPSGHVSTRHQYFIFADKCHVTGKCAWWKEFNRFQCVLALNLLNHTENLLEIYLQRLGSLRHLFWMWFNLLKRKSTIHLVIGVDQRYSDTRLQKSKPALSFERR